MRKLIALNISSSNLVITDTKDIYFFLILTLHEYLDFFATLCF